MTIEIDFDVFKMLTARRENEGDSYNAVLRRLLGLSESAKENDNGPSENCQQKMWRHGGAELPCGTALRAHYKSQRYEAELTDTGISIGATIFRTPSSAAMSITKTNVNGWTFWKFKNPSTGGWQPLSSARPVSSRRRDPMGLL